MNCLVALAASFLFVCLAEAGGFSKIVLSDRYLCDGIAAGDIDGDGHQDVVAGPYCYYGPDFNQKSEIYPPVSLDPAVSPSNSMFSFVADFNSDENPDVLVLGRVHRHQAFWYENPGKKKAPWKKHFAFHRVKGESPTLHDIDGDGSLELLTHNEKYWGWIAPKSGAPYEPWVFRSISERGEWPQFYHGMGIGDLDSDGRLDILLNEGWYRQPEPSTVQKEWPKSTFLFSDDRGGAQMFAYDIDGDKDADVVTSLNAHEWGLAWFENRGNKSAPSFDRHMIMGTREEQERYGVAFSQPHALEIGDINGDGLRDIVVGKRMWAHGPKGDVEPSADPVLYWFELNRSTSGTVTFVPHLVDAASGVGVQIDLADLDGDGRLDILSASKLGTFIFLNRL